MLSLFLVYLGGRTARSNIELHDIRFVAAAKIEDTYPLLREQWFSDLKGLHLDSYLTVKFVDGYRVELSETPYQGPQRLYFVNLGGYNPQNIAELHEFGLFVATSPEKAKRIARTRLLVDCLQQHKDDLFALDDCLAIDKVQQYFVHLTPDSRSQSFAPDWFGYKVIG